MTNDKLHYFRIAKELNKIFHAELIRRKLHFRGNVNSFALISISQEFPEIGKSGLKTSKEGEEILNTITLVKPKRPTPEKKLQAWIIDYAMNNQLKLPFGGFTFLTSELVSGKREKIVNDILAIDNKNTLVIIELKSTRTNDVKLQTEKFKREVKEEPDFFYSLIQLLLDVQWNGKIRSVSVWPKHKNKWKPRPQKHPEVEEINYELNDCNYTFK